MVVQGSRTESPRGAVLGRHRLFNWTRRREGFVSGDELALQGRGPGKSGCRVSTGNDGSQRQGNTAERTRGGGVAYTRRKTRPGSHAIHVCHVISQRQKCT